MSHAINRRRLAGVLLAAAGAAIALPAYGQASRYGRVARRESEYATTYIDREGQYLTMRFGINDCLFTESRYNLDDAAELPVMYTQYMTVALAYASRARNVVEIGLGGGRIATYLHDFVPTTNVTCVELDPGVVELAQRYFGVRPGARMRLVTRDGRIFMARADERYDIILLDAYQGTLAPFHLVTREFYTILKDKLEPGGAVAQNISPVVLDLGRMVATARSVFAHVDLYPAQRNWVLIAHDGPAKSNTELIARAAALQSAYNLRYPLERLLRDRNAEAAAGNARPFTDDFAPVGYGNMDRRCRAGR